MQQSQPQREQDLLENAKRQLQRLFYINALCSTLAVLPFLYNLYTNAGGPLTPAVNLAACLAFAWNDHRALKNNPTKRDMVKNSSTVTRVIFCALVIGLLSRTKYLSTVSVVPIVDVMCSMALVTTLLINYFRHSSILSQMLQPHSPEQSAAGNARLDVNPITHRRHR